MSTITAERIVYRKPSRKPGFVGLPHAEISIQQCADGRWMWAYSFATSLGGEGFGPFPKWGLFEDSRDAAVSAAVNKMIERLQERHWGDHPHVRELTKWAEGVLDDLHRRCWAGLRRSSSWRCSRRGNESQTDHLLDADGAGAARRAKDADAADREAAAAIC